MVATIADNCTTWIALQHEGVYESNLISAWLFDQLGLLPGLAVDFIATAILLFVFYKHRLSNLGKIIFLTPAIAITFYAAYNNYMIILSFTGK